MKIFKFNYLIRTALILIFFSIFFLFGAYAHKYGLIGFLKVNIIEIPNIVSKIYNAQRNKYGSSFPRLSINLNDSDLKLLLDRRKNILEYKTDETVIETFDDTGQFVSAEIKYNDNSYLANITLGDSGDDKIPFRAKITEDKKILNVNKFLLRHPKVRNYIFEWLFHQAHKYEDGIHLYYDFVKVDLNNKYLGIYAIEESFGKNLLIKNNRKNSPILKFDMSIHEKSIQYNKGEDFGVDPFRFNKIVTWQEENNYINDKEFNENYLKAANKLYNFANDNYKTSQVFDITKMAMYVALCDLFQGQHALHNNNLTLYYNPDTSLLEPISFNSNSMDNRFDLAIESSKKYKSQNLLKKMFEDEAFIYEYVKFLKKFSKKEYLKKFLSMVDLEMKNKSNFINLEYFYYTKSHQKIHEKFFSNQKFLNASLNPVKGIDAILKKTKGRNLILLLGSVQYFPIEIKYIIIDKEKIPLNVDTLKGIDSSGKVSYKEFSFNIPEHVSLNENYEKRIEIAYKLIGLDKIYKEKVNHKNYITID